MVTVRELFSTELPELPAGPNPSCLSVADAEVAFSLLGREAGSGPLDGGGGSGWHDSSLAPAAGLLGLPPRPSLGPSTDVVPCSREELDARYAAVQDARERASEHLRLALERRCASRLSAASAPPGRGSVASSRGGTGGWRPWSSATDNAEDIPAVFPFPEPIPYGPPDPRPSRQPHGSRGPSRGSGGGPPGSSRAGSRMRCHEDVDFVPAVFPFPEPIPQGPPSPRRRRSQASRRSGQRNSSFRESISGGSGSGSSSACGVEPSSEGWAPQSRKEACHEDEFHFQNKRRANAWISECKPRLCLLKHERPYFVRARQAEERRRKRTMWMYHHMPTMPFAAWCEMRRQEEAEELAQFQADKMSSAAAAGKSGSR